MECFKNVYKRKSSLHIYAFWHVVCKVRCISYSRLRSEQLQLQKHNAQRAADGQRTFVYLDSDYIREQFSQGLHVTPVSYGGHLVRSQRKRKAPKEIQ